MIDGVIDSVAEHAALAAWRRVADRAEPRRAGPARVTVLKDRGHSNVYRIEGAGPEGTAVIAKHCSSASARIETMVYRDILPGLGVPALEFHGSVEDESGDPDKSCWLFLEDAGDEGYSRDLEQHRVLAGRWLGQLHAAASRLDHPPFLAQRGPAWYLAELRSVIESMHGSLSNAALSEDDLRTLHAVLRHCDVLETRWHRIVGLCEGVPPTLVHGDLAGKNTRVRASGAGMTIFALDWETANWGSPAIDLAQNALRPDLETWRSAMQHAFAGFVDEETASRVAEAGRIFRLIVSMSWETARLAGVWPVRAMWHMNSYHAVLADCIRSARWEETWRPA